MKRTKELISGLTLVTALAVGTSACGGATKKAEQQPAPAAANTYTPGLQHLAGSLINAAKQSSNHYTDKPPYSIGFDVALAGGGKLSFEAQTPTPQLDPAQVEMIDVSQTVPSGRSFDLSFDVRPDGQWNAQCSDNVGGGNAISEIGQQTVYAGNKAVYKNPAEANAVLGDDVTNATNTLQTAATHITDSPLQPLPDLCAINLG